MMEAANLGAFLAPYPDIELNLALATLSKAPKFGATDEWLKTACDVRESSLKAPWHSPEPPGSFNRDGARNLSRRHAELLPSERSRTVSGKPSAGADGLSAN